VKLYESQINYLKRLGNRPFIFAEVGTGKTAMALYRAQHSGTKKCLVVCPASVRDSEQWEQEVENFKLTFEDFQVKGFSFLQRAKKQELQAYADYYVIIDECFVGETLVQTASGEQQIRDVKIGDKVQSYNHETHRVEPKIVTRLIKKEYTGKYYCIFSSHGAIIATYNHPVMTQDGYKMAQDVVEGDTVYERVDNSKQNTQIWGNPEVQVLREHTSGERLEPKTGAAISREGLANMQRGLRSELVRGGIEQASQQESQQPSSSGKSTSDLEGEWDSLANMGEGQEQGSPQGWEWQYIPLATVTLREVRQSEQRLDYGAANTDERAEKPTQISDLLQSRYRERLLQACGRVRRTKPPRASEVQRQEEGRKIRAARVERVAVLEREDIERHGLSSEPNTVYCIEVEGNSNFFANDMLVHNCHKIKNDQSKQGKGAYELCRSTKYGYSLLSGTPMGKWADAVNYGKITGFVRNKTHFYNLFVITQKYKGYPEIVGYRDEKVLRRWWQSIALRLRAEECIELPSRQDFSIKIPIKLTKYREMRKTSMRDDEVLDSPSKMCWALRQYAEQSAEKINWVVEKVEGLENALIFANTTEAINKLSQALRKAGIKHGLWTGKKHDDFAKNDVMIVQYQAGGTGLNLQKFNTTIFLSPCYSFNDFTQAIGRTHRNGQKKKCVFYMLEAKGTIDEDIYRVLEKRQDFDDRLINKELEKK